MVMCRQRLAEAILAVAGKNMQMDMKYGLAAVGTVGQEQVDVAHSRSEARMAAATRWPTRNSCAPISGSSSANDAAAYVGMTSTCPGLIGCTSMNAATSSSR